MDARQPERETLGREITELLSNYKLSHTLNEEGDDGFPLVDALTPPGDKTIERGSAEIELLVGEIVWLVIPAVTPNASHEGPDESGGTPL